MNRDRTSERLALRRFTDDDAQFVWELHANPDLLRFIPSAAMPTLTDAAEWITRTRTRASEDRGWWCAALHDGTPVGAALLVAVRYSEGHSGDEVEVGWRLHPAHTGRGYATEAGGLMLAAAFAGGLTRVIAVVDPDNTASQAVCRRLGMTHLGRDGRYYDEDLEVFEARAPR